jgi:hypothetical protein
MKYIMTVLKWLPAILSAIKGVEEIIGEGQGKTKKELVLAALAVVAGEAQKMDNATLVIVGSLIDTFVGILNTSGIFKTKTPVV